MKSKFSSIDISAVVNDLQKVIGMRVINVYDMDSKTYLVKLHKPGEKTFILFESGIRMHLTTHDWPKSQVPNGFSMKFRKHINQKRLTSAKQLGTDRIIDLTLGDEERACHVIVELYDRGNLILTDSDYKILNVLRPRTDKDHDVRFSVRETYPVELARKDEFLPSLENITLFLESSKPDDLVKKALVRHVPFNGQLLEHGLIVIGLAGNAKIKDLGTGIEAAEKLSEALKVADEVTKQVYNNPSNGYITYKKITKTDGSEGELYEEYNPVKLAQFSSGQFSIKEFPTFSEAVDNFYSLLDSQKLHQKAAQIENEAIKKVDNVRKDHEKRVKALNEAQETKQRRAELIEMNRELVDKCLTVIRQAVANKMPWDEISKWLKSAASQGNDLAKMFVRLNLLDNSIVLRLTDPYEHLDDENLSDEDDEKPKKPKKTYEVEVDLDLNASQNSRKYFVDRKAAGVKQTKTLQSSEIALKNAQKVAQNKVKQVRTNVSIARARKTMWFEKFYWCISTEGYLMIGGRDAQQNEIVVKRYLRPGDYYVHADLNGASSVVIRNKTRDGEIPPMTLTEAGSLAVCYSSAWDANTAVSAWWVYHHQVSRTAPTGEYLPTGSFMIRGKKNYLLGVQLQLGFGLMFRLDEESTQRHLLEKKERQSLRSASVSVDQSEVGEGEEMDLNDAEDEDQYPDVEVKLDSLKVDDNQEEGKANEVEDEEEEDLLENLDTEEAILSSLTSEPKPDDGLLFIVAVCGPYTAMQKFKYKVKITPGTGKRGKAVKSALALFQTDKSATPAERDLVKSLSSDPAVIQQMPGKVRMNAPQLMRLKKS